ncbi:MAG: hypothetical protein ACXWRE_05045 [Pseudobdellovibrionaceae bacterium]
MKIHGTLNPVSAKKIMPSLFLMVASFSFFLASFAFAEGRLKSCEVQESLENIKYYLNYSYFYSSKNSTQVHSYTGKEKDLTDFYLNSQALIHSLEVSFSQQNEKQLISNFYDLIMAVNDLQSHLPFPHDMNSTENQKLANDQSNINQIIITATGTRACLNK